MATKRSRGVWRPAIPRGNPPPGNLGDVCAIFTREEIADWFREWEATLVETVNKAVEQAKRARAAEWPLPPEDHPPAADDPAAPVVKMK